MGSCRCEVHVHGRQLLDIVRDGVFHGWPVGLGAACDVVAGGGVRERLRGKYERTVFSGRTFAASSLPC